MVVTHLFQVLAFLAMEPPIALEQQPIGEEKNKVFRSMLPTQPHDVARGQYTGYRQEEGVDPESESETFIALKWLIDNWRWASVPFYPPGSWWPKSIHQLIAPYAWRLPFERAWRGPIARAAPFALWVEVWVGKCGGEMSRAIHRLTTRSVQSRTRPGYYPDGAGLYLQFAAS